MCAAMLMATPVALAAQGAPPDPALVTAVSTLTGSARVRLLTQAPHVGSIRGVQADSVLLEQRDGLRHIALQDIRTVSRSIRQTRKGATIGVVTGAVLLGLGSYGLSSAFCESTNCNDDKQTSLFYGGVLGAGIGLGIGAGLGSLVHGWRVVYAKAQ